MNSGNSNNKGAPNLISERKGLVRLLRNHGITNSEVLEAINSVPRERFVEHQLVSRSYENIPLPIGHHQTISQPYIVALMTGRLITRSARRDTVLEIGTGSGYQTAILAKLYNQVYTVERIRDLFVRADKILYELKICNVELRYGDGSEGWGGGLNFDSIMITAATDKVPNPLLKELSCSGCLIAPVGTDLCRVALVTGNCNGTFTKEMGESVRFVPLLCGVLE